jgi:hypothetical protein
MEQVDNHWQTAARPMSPDLPILARYRTALIQSTQPDAVAEIRQRIDRLLD